MATKLRNFTNPLTRASYETFAVNPFSHNQFYPALEFRCCKVECLMDRLLERQKIESMRRTMLTHEEMFKQQVKELHHIYNLQKKLMHEVKNGIRRRSEITAETGSCCSGESSRMQLRFDLCETTKSSIHLVEEQKDLKVKDDDVEVELTLSIGNSTMKKTSKSHLSQLRDFDQVMETGPSSIKMHQREECVEPSSAVSGSTLSVCQDNSRSHWLLQDHVASSRS